MRPRYMLKPQIIWQHFHSLSIPFCQSQNNSRSIYNIKTNNLLVRFKQTWNPPYIQTSHFLLLNCQIHSKGRTKQWISTSKCVSGMCTSTQKKTRMEHDSSQKICSFYLHFFTPATGNGLESWLPNL